MINGLENNPQFLLMICHILDKLFKWHVPIKVLVTKSHNLLQFTQERNHFKVIGQLSPDLLSAWPTDPSTDRLTNQLTEGLMNRWSYGLTNQLTDQRSKIRNSTKLCGSRKYPYLPHGRILEIPRGRGISKAKIFKGKSEAKLEIQGAAEPKTHPCGRYGYFLEPYILKKIANFFFFQFVKVVFNLFQSYSRLIIFRLYFGVF